MDRTQLFTKRKIWRVNCGYAEQYQATRAPVCGCEVCNDKWEAKLASTPLAERVENEGPADWAENEEERCETVTPFGRCQLKKHQYPDRLHRIQMRPSLGE